ncbi:RNA-dependent RNA polymerase [Pueraria lobata-associated emaravirus]|uniref:RNA-directed RNA polymerase L n=1 Tax=Pueraria lobata-associated emaravirus TaxID=2944626 RepID=A0AAE9KXM1_9VIRU|nr:RNA-dependent RNA polymerase [Pueraria lobata-associated emaravirus]
MEAKKGQIYEEAVDAIKSGNVLTPDIMKKFLHIVGKSLQNYTISSKKRAVEKVYKQCLADADFSRDTTRLAEQVLYSPTNPGQIDIAATLIGLLELIRHDTLLASVNGLLQEAGYTIMGYDIAIKEIFPEIDSILTPDIFFKKDDDYYILELKVRNKNTNLSPFYDRYKAAVVGHRKSIKVGVFNVARDGFVQMGDYSLSEMINIDPEMIGDVIHCISLCDQLRAKYNTYPQFAFFINDGMVADNHEPFIESGFKQMSLEHPDITEVSSLFGTKWDQLVNDMDSLSLLSNQDETTDVILNAHKDLYQNCSENYEQFAKHFRDSYLNTKSYGKTTLENTNLKKILDDKNSEKYNITKKYKPSVYIPIAKTVFLDGYNYSRLDFYKSAFVDIQPKGDPYTRSVINLVDTIFNSVAIDLLIKKNEEIDPDIYRDVLTPEFCKYINDTSSKFKKIANVSSITSDTSILNNNTFSIHHHVDKFMKENICGFQNKHYDSTIPKKDCLLIKDCEDDMLDLIRSMDKIFNSKHYEGVYANDLVSVDCDNMNNHVCNLPSACRTKYLDHLYSQHNIFKALISLNTVNSHKFRLIQTADPCTILIMLPNADTLKTAPLRYFTLTIIDKKDEVSYHANKLLGIAHHLLMGRNYNIILSKVISLDVTRLKLLNHSFGKYCLVMTYYSNLKKNLRHVTHFMVWMLCQFVTISSLSITDTYKNFIMAIYSDYSNIDTLIEDKLESRPTTLAHTFILQQCFNGLTKASDQLKVIGKNRNVEDVDDRGDLVQTGFNNNLSLKLPISGISVNNPREIIHESFMLFYLGNKGLHGSPQELLKLYYTPYKFEKEYEEMLKSYNVIIQEDGNNSNMSFSYDALRCTSITAYANLYNKKDVVRQSICAELDLDKPILSLKQFSSTKAMVSNVVQDQIDVPNKLPDDTDIYILEKIITECKIEDEHEFMRFINSEVYRINSKRIQESSVNKLKEEKKEVTLLPEIYIENIKGVRFIKIKRHEYTRMISGEYINQKNAKVFDEFFRLTEKYDLVSTRDAYKQLIHDNDLLIRIFYKDQRTSEDREIYTGNAQTRLCLYPIEKTYKGICRHIPGEAITISGDQKQKKLLDQRLILIKEKRQKIRDKKEAEIYSVSSDAQKWSARDVVLKFLIPISTNPYLHPDEKWFLFFLLLKYYKKNIVLTDSIFNKMINLVSNDKTGAYEEMTGNFTKNYFTVRSNWLQGNLNMMSSFVHHCATLYTETMLRIVSDRYRLECSMTSMVHSDDSTYDFLICNGSNRASCMYTRDENIGKFIISLITYSNKKHCITLNEKKTYISTFYKEFLSTIIVGNELFFFYLADLLPLTSDTSYASPLQDLASYSGYVNNSFSHACPRNMIQTAIILINHLTLSTYNMQYTSDKNPRLNINSTDLPIQIYPRYKLPIEIAGMIPYYAADAFNILNDIVLKLQKYDKLKSELVEDVLTIELIDEYLKITKRNSPDIIKYLKACILCMDYSQYERDDADPYNIIDYDLSQKSIINVISLNKGSRLRKTYTYKRYLESESLIRLTAAIHPEWCVSKPRDPELIKSNILQNYTNPNFRDGLIFSTPAIDYGRRIISSNRNVYTISSHVMEKDHAKNIKTVYKDLNTKIDEVDLNAKDVQRYLSLYLLSDKKISMAIQVFFSKVETVTMARPAYNKVIQPRSVYAEDFGKYSNTSLVESFLTSRHCKITSMDPKAEKFVEICKYVMERIGDIKVYECPEDIDDDYVRYYNFKYPDSDEITIDVEVIDDLDQVGYDIYKNKIKFMSLLVKYFNDIKKTTENPKYNLPNYPSPSSIIMTIDSLMRKDEISTKVYLSNIKTIKYDDYLLTRFGMYAHNDFHIKYKLGYKVRIASSSRISQTLQTYRDTYEPVAFAAKLLSRSPELFETLMQNEYFQTGHYRFWDMVDVLKSSKDINSSALLLILGQIESNKFLASLVSDRRVYNHWLIESNSSQADPNLSLVYYMCQGNVMKVRTFTQNGAIVFTMTYMKFINADYGALESIKNKIAQDFHGYLLACKVTKLLQPTSKYGAFNINEYGRHTTSTGERVRTVCPIYYDRINTIKPAYSEVGDSVKLTLNINTNIDSLDFEVRVKTHIDEEYYLECLIDNLEIANDAILGHICDGMLLHRHTEHLNKLLPRMGPNHMLSLMSNFTDADCATDNLDINKYGFLAQIGVHFELQGFEFMSNVCESLQIVALNNKVDISQPRNPSKFINSCNRIKLNPVCHDNIVQKYKADETVPYWKLFRLIMKYRYHQAPVEKMILFIILIFRFYIHDYLTVNEEFEF